MDLSHKKHRGRGTADYTHHFTILLTTLHDNADRAHHTNRTEENRAQLNQSLTCIAELLLTNILCLFIVV